MQNVHFVHRGFSMQNVLFVPAYHLNLALRNRWIFSSLLTRHFQQPWMLKCPWPLFLNSQEALECLGPASAKIFEGSISSPCLCLRERSGRFPELYCGLLKKSPLYPPSYPRAYVRCGKHRAVNAWELQREHKFLCNFLLVWCAIIGMSGVVMLL